MLKILRYVILTCLLYNTALFAQQREANIWYFGRYLGLDFNSGVATPLNNGQLNTTEGVATICDATGALLFYTDGIRIWNRNHNVMPNGNGLLGDPSSSQSAVIVPRIGDPTRYYVFTVAQLGGPNGLNYSVVNMTLAAGNGDVELKNVPLTNNVTEKITAVRHCNNRDVWVLARKTVSDTYNAFLVSPTGVNTTPVVSNTGSVLAGIIPPSPFDSTTLGCMKASPDGKKIAAAHWSQNVDICDFDNATGIVSNGKTMYVPGDPHYLSYGVEFSQDSKLLYSSVFYTDPVNAIKRNAIFQYDVTLPTVTAIRASRQTISLTSDPIDVYGSLQIAPDGKMYVAKRGYPNIAAIENPNVAGPGCNFVSNSVAWSLPNQVSSYGLPTFVQSYFYPPDSFTYTTGCDLNVAFNYDPAANVNSVRWNFGDPSTSTNNSSTLNSPSHLFSAAGTYTIELIKFTACGSDTIRKQLNTNGIYFSLGADTLVCGATSLVLNGSGAGGMNTYLWSNGSTNSTLTVNTSGLYWVEVSNTLGCNKRDSINVTFKQYPVFNLGADRAICSGDTLTLNAAVVGAAGYLWNNNSTSSTIRVFATGTYWCQADNSGCVFRDSLTITGINPLPVVNLGNDVTVCEGVPVNLNAAYLNATYLWQNGTTSPSFTVLQPGSYWVQLDLNGCKKSDTVIVSHNLKPKFSLGPDQVICNGNSITLRPSLNPVWTLSWQDASSGPTYNVTQPGTYSLSATNSCGTATDEVVVSNGLCKVFVPTGFTPNNDGRNDLFRALGTERVVEFSLKIFERGGQVVFQTTDKTKGWDGKMGGLAFNSGVFIYLIQYKEQGTNQAEILKGTLTLIR